MSYGLLQGKYAVITGARGIAAGIAEAYANEGAKIVVISASGSGAKLVEKGIADHALIADLGNRVQLRNAFDEALTLLGGHIDILVNCAGIQRRHDVEDYPIEDWDAVIETDLTAVMELSQLAGRVMIAQGNGKIINIASMNSFFGGTQGPAYSAAKGGVVQLTKACANAWAGKGLNINAIAPGYILTDLTGRLKADEKMNNAILSRIPAGRWGTPEDIAGPAVFLASSLSDYMNGSVIPVDGGYLGM